MESNIKRLAVTVKRAVLEPRRLQVEAAIFISVTHECEMDDGTGCRLPNRVTYPEDGREAVELAEAFIAEPTAGRVFIELEASEFEPGCVLNLYERQRCQTIDVSVENNTGRTEHCMTSDGPSL